MKKYKHIVLISFYDRICLSTRYLSSSLKKQGYKVSLIFLKDDRTAIIDKLKTNNKQYQILSLNTFIGCDIDVNPFSKNEIELFKHKLIDLNPDVIGISSRSVHLELSLNIADIVKEILPSAMLIAGGYGASIDPKSFLTKFDYCFIGESESALIQLLESKEPDNSPNLAKLKNGKLKINTINNAVNLDSLPFPDWDFTNKYMIEDNKIKIDNEYYNTKTYDVFASRGCPSSCSYCGACQWGKLIGNYGKTFPKVRFRSPENVIEELEYAKENYGITYVRFKDSIFGPSKKWLFEFLDMYDKRIGLDFHCLLDERYTSKSKIRRLKESGLHSTTIGIQSANEEITKNILFRNITNEGLLDYAEMLITNDIQIKYDILGWNPFETEETLMQGVNLLSKLPKANQIAVFQLKVFPGTPLYSMYKNKSESELNFKRYSFWAVIYSMILYSSYTENLALDLIKDKNSTFEQAFKIFNNHLEKVDEEYFLFANTDIKKGETITNVMLKAQKRDYSDAVPYYQKNLIVNRMIASNEISKGEPILRKNLFSTYESFGDHKAF